MRQFLQTTQTLFLLICIAAGNLLFSERAWGEEVLRITEDFESAPLGHYLEMYEDKEKTLTVEKVADEGFEGKFIPLKSEIPNFGFSNSVYWLKFTVSNPENREVLWSLEIDHPLLDSIELFSPMQNGLFSRKFAGDSKAFSERELNYRNFVFPFKSESSSRKTFFMRVESTSGVMLPAVVWSQKSFMNKVIQEQIILGAYFGIMVSMALYNFFLFLFAKDRSYLFYVLFIASFMLVQFANNGLAFQYLWPNSTWMANNSIPMLVCFCMLMGQQFVRAFLNTEQNTPRLDRVIRYAMILPLMGICLPFAFTFPFALKIALTFSLLFTILSILCGIFSIRNGYTPARYFMLAWSSLFIGVTFYLFSLFAILPQTHLTKWAPQIGSAAEVILLSLGLADRIRLMRQEKSQMETELLLSRHETELSTEKTRLEELGHVAVKLGDKLNTPLHIMQLSAEELQDVLTIDISHPKAKDCRDLCEKITRNVFVMKKEICNLSTFKAYAPKDALTKDFARPKQTPEEYKAS
jgi:hypothetical protein